MQNATAKFGKCALAAVLSILLPSQAIFAKCVSLDIKNPNRNIDKALKPYHKAMRERIEAEWVLLDPHCGRTIIIEFTVLSHGKIVIPKFAEYAAEEEDLRLLPVTALRAVNYLPALPDGQADLAVTGEFVSTPPPHQGTITQNDGTGQTNDGQTRRRIKKTLLVLAALAAAGGAVVGLIALERSINNSGSGNESTDIEFVHHPYRRAIDGAWVQGYHRSRANGTIIDNFSTQGNVNPFNGKPGWVPLP